MTNGKALRVSILAAFPKIGSRALGLRQFRVTGKSDEAISNLLEAILNEEPLGPRGTEFNS